MEGNLPFQLGLKDPDFNVNSLGFDDFEGQLKDSMSAHPRIDLKTGQLHNVAYDMGTGEATYYRFDKDRKLMNKVPVKLTNPRVIHDMQFTDDYAIIADLPVEFDPQRVFSEDGGPISFNKNGAARYGFLRRDAENSDDIIWIDSPDKHYCYHFVNAVQDGDYITLHGCIWDDMDFDLKLEHPD